jgi:HEAT repeat protein
VLAALGRIGEPDALDAAFRCLDSEGRFTRRSAAIAVGQIASRAPDRQVQAVERLAAFRREEKDLAAWSFATLALGRIAASKGSPEEVRDAVAEALLAAFRKEEKAYRKAYVALAMGVAGGADRFAPLLRRELAGGRGDDYSRGGYAVALGLLKDRESVGLLTSVLTDRTRRPRLREAAATGLGLIGDPVAGKPLLEVLGDREDRDLQVGVAAAARRLGERRAVDILMAELRAPKASMFVKGSSALALGKAGDHRAVDPLLALTGAGHPDLLRALAFVALGQLADRREIPLLFRLRRDVNYRASCNAIDEMLCIL